VAFSSLRQLGAAFELAAYYLRWPGPYEDPGLAAAAAPFALIAQGTKSLLVKLARAVNTRREFDAGTAVAPIAQVWDEGMGLIAQALARR